MATLTEHKSETEHYFIDENGQKQGEYKEWHDNGQLYMHCFFVDDKRHGEFKRWYPNGQLSRHCFYVDDNLHGEFKRWHYNGQLSQHCFYVDDNLHGEYKAWYSNGQLWEHFFFVDGKEVIDFLEEPEEYPVTAEAKTYFALKYGSGKWLP
jgi:antitoxin component YwqK of YwqJK toxin-antitoxin module